MTVHDTDRRPRQRTRPTEPTAGSRNHQSTALGGVERDATHPRPTLPAGRQPVPSLERGWRR